MKKLIIVLLILTLVPAFAFAIEKKDNGWKNNEAPSIHFEENFKPYSTISIGFGYRTDNNKYLEHSPTMHVRLYTYLKPAFATKLGIGYNNSTRTDEYYSYYLQDVSDLILEAGFRLQEPHSSFSIYFESGFEVHNYKVHRGNSANITKSGVSFAFGSEIKISKNAKLDLSFRKTFNHVDRYYAVLEGMNTPPIDLEHSFDYFPYNLSDDFFNPTSIQLLISFKL